MFQHTNRIFYGVYNITRNTFILKLIIKICILLLLLLLVLLLMTVMQIIMLKLCFIVLCPYYVFVECGDVQVIVSVCAFYCYQCQSIRVHRNF